MYKIDDLMRIAENEVGYLEKSSNSDLDDKTANAGSNNYTKYGRDLVKAIGSPYANGVAWCDEFVDWCFMKAYGKAGMKELLIGFSAYTPTSAEYFKKSGQWFVTGPKAGDIIFFKNTTRICHTGIVYKVDGTKVYTIEGNTTSGSEVIANGGGVYKKSYLLSNTKISGYGRPKYDDTEDIVIPDDGLVHGIDISANQGTVNFSMLKNQGVQFVVLRSTTKNGQADAKFYQYLNACKTYDIDYSCYKYSYATSALEALAEANSVIELLKGQKMTIWYDVENVNQINKIGMTGLTAVCESFIEACKRAGYDVGIYCNLNWYNNYISKTLKNKYKFWIARYGKNNGLLDIRYKPVNAYAWQYTSVGKIEGITGNVDLDVIL